MNIIKSLWALLPMACLALASCSSEEATDSAQQKPENLKPVATIDIPITATAVVDGSKTRAEVVSDNKTLIFAAGDKLWVTGKITSESAIDNDSNFPYTLNGWLDVAITDTYTNPDFVGTLHYTEYEYIDSEHSESTHDWPGLGDKNPISNYHSSFALSAVLKGLYQDEASWPGEVADVSQLTSLNFSSHPLCVANGNSSALNEAVKKYSLLVATTEDTGIRPISDLTRVMFHLNQQTVFLNFTVTFNDGTPAGTNLGTVTVTNNGETIGSGTVTTIASGNAVIANFVVPVAAGTVLNNAKLNIPYNAAMSIGTNETLVAGTVYTINKTIADRVQLWSGGPYFATKNVGAETINDRGLYFAWGETTGYSKDEEHNFDWPAYSWASGGYTSSEHMGEYRLTKYCWDESYGANGYTDELVILEAGDDAATANWGDEWRMPRNGELATLSNYLAEDKVTSSWVSNFRGSGVAGRLFVGTEDGYTDHYLFMPATGSRSGTGWVGDASHSSIEGSSGGCWSSVADAVYDQTYCAWALTFDSDDSLPSPASMFADYRYMGYSVRAVSDSE